MRFELKVPVKVTVRVAVRVRVTVRVAVRVTVRVTVRVAVRVITRVTVRVMSLRCGQGCQARNLAIHPVIDTAFRVYFKKVPKIEVVGEGIFPFLRPIRAD